MIVIYSVYITTGVLDETTNHGARPVGMRRRSYYCAFMNTKTYTMGLNLGGLAEGVVALLVDFPAPCKHTRGRRKGACRHKEFGPLFFDSSPASST